jgi:GTPase SAR1 family protein
MRKRSYTIEASTIEEYQREAIEKNPQIENPSGSKDEKHQNSRKRVGSFEIQIQPNHQVSMRGRIGSFTLEKPKDIQWDDVYYNIDEAAISKTYEIQQQTQPEPTVENDQSESDELSPKRCAVKCMVMGSTSSDRYEIINSVFNLSDVIPLQQTMDLLLKVEGENSERKIYQIWMRALDGNKYDSVIKTYYKKISIFIFIYSVNDKDSFQMLETAINSVAEEINDKFLGILIGTTSQSLDDREVLYEEGEKLKKDKGLSMFIEAKPGDDSLKSVLKDVLKIENG